MRTPTRCVLLVALCLVGFVGVVAGSGAAETGQTGPSPDGPVTTLADGHVAGCAAESPPDQADPDGDTSDVVGWVDGYWYDEPLDVEQPLTEAELDELVARTAARVEALRCLTFDEVPPTEMRTRAQHRDDIEAQFDETVTQADADFQNAQLATTLIAGQSTDAIELQLDVQTAFPAAFYDTETEFIGFITENPDRVELDQVTLAHELLHALQDQQFELGAIFEEPTTDGFTSSLAVVEGDAVLVEERYRENCQAGAWVDDCLTQVPGKPEIPSWPLTLEQLAAYNTPLVEQTDETEGWDGVNALFDEMPVSTVEAIYPERYGSYERPDLTVEDRSDEAWDRVEPEETDHDILGQHTLTAILVAPFFESEDEIVDIDEFAGPFGTDFDYGHPVTEGWEGDRFHAYTDGEDTAGVWQLAWEDADAAATFADAFGDLAEHRGGTDRGNVYTFEDSDEYEMALGVERDDDRLLVVTAPTVGELDAVHGPFEAGGTDGDRNGTGDGTGNGDTNGDETGDSDTNGDGVGDGNGDANGDTADDSGPGFGVVVVVVAAVAGLAAVRRRQ